jgi:hypothetical protein
MEDNMSWQRVYRVICVVVLAVGLATPLMAQTMIGDWTGVVTDASGAGIPGAIVTIIKQDTAARQSAPTDATGTYRISQVLPGTYTIEVEAQNFKRYEQTGIDVRPTELKSVDVKLEVGSVTQTVVVKDKAPTITTESPSLTVGIPQALNDLPLQNEASNGYIFDAATWIPGSASGNAVYSFAGNEASFDETNIEGISHDIYYNFFATTAISEVNVVMSNAPAEYARPVTMDATLRSGTNRLTGEVRWDFTNPCSNGVNNPFTQVSPAAHRTCPTTHYLYYTGGGPVYIPHVYDGRNKTFFFFTINKNPTSSENGLQIPWGITIPTQAMIQGNYAGYPKTIVDPVTGQPFPGNQIPTTRFSQMANRINSEYLGPSDPIPFVYINNGFSDNAVQQYGLFSQGLAYVIKIDHNLGSKDIISAAYTMHTTTSAQSNNSSAQSGTASRVPDYQATVFPDHNVIFSETHTFSPNVVNELRAGMTRDLDRGFNSTGLNTTPNSGNAVLNDWGIQGINPVASAGEPEFLITGFLLNTEHDTSLRVDQRWEVYDNVAFHKGKHTIKAGVSGIKIEQNGIVVGDTFGNFTFNGTFTKDAYADFLLGLPSAFDLYHNRAEEGLRRWDIGAFVQDDFRLTSKLTLNFGLRYEKFTVPYDKNDEYYNVNPANQHIIVPDAKAASLIAPAWNVNEFPVQTAAQANFPSKLYYGTYSIQPRFGFAYKIGSNSVVRGGYGIYNGAALFNSLQLTGPFAITSNFTNVASTTSGTGALYSLPDPFPAATAYAPFSALEAISPHYRVPYSQDWNLTFEREVARNWGLELTYRGTKSTQLLWNENLNQVVASTTPFSTAEQPYPSLSTYYYIANGANDHYDAALIQVTHPWTNGLYMTATYTKEYSDTTAVGSTFAVDQSAPAPEYAYNRQRDYGRNPPFPTNDFILNFRDDLQVGKGKRLLPNANRFENAVFGNWEWVGSFSWRSGWFFTPVLNGVDPGNLGNTSSRRASLVPGCNPLEGERNVHGLWYNPACYTTPPAGQLGNEAPDSLTGPGAWVLNFNPYKDFPLGFREGAKLRVGANIFNILNHPVYGTPNTNLNSTTAGHITATSYPRGTSNQLTGDRAFIFDVRIIY